LHFIRAITITTFILLNLDTITNRDSEY
jgi:hypothetical protein